MLVRAGWNVSDAMDEASLVRKLVMTWHLNVPERRALPGGVARLSLIRAVIAEVLESNGTFPPGVRLDEPFNGGFLEPQPDGSVRLYWGAEVAMARFEVVGMKAFATRAEAIDAYIVESYQGQIDGIPIDASS